MDLQGCLKLGAQGPDLTPLVLTGHWLWAGLESGFFFSRDSSHGGLTAEGCLRGDPATGKGFLGPEADLGGTVHVPLPCE